jgi:hypothetical protein
LELISLVDIVEIGAISGITMSVSKNIARTVDAQGDCLRV